MRRLLSLPTQNLPGAIAARVAGAAKRFVKRASFLADCVSELNYKAAPDSRFGAILATDRARAHDAINFVSKRQLGFAEHREKNARLNRRTIALRGENPAQDSRAARWSAANPLRIEDPPVQARLRAKGPLYSERS